MCLPFEHCNLLFRYHPADDVKKTHRRFFVSMVCLNSRTLFWQRSVRCSVTASFKSGLWRCWSNQFYHTREVTCATTVWTSIALQNDKTLCFDLRAHLGPLGLPSVGCRSLCKGVCIQQPIGREIYARTRILLPKCPTRNMYQPNNLFDFFPLIDVLIHQINDYFFAITCSDTWYLRGKEYKHPSHLPASYK